MANFKQWAKTPPLGWNSWDCFGAGVTEKELLANADYMAKNLKEYGWQYIVCDIQWYEPKSKDNDYNNFTELEMDEYGRLIPASNRFPSSANGKGFKPIADYIHSLGLKFGIHIMRGVPRQAVAQNCKILGSDKTCRQIAHHFSVCSWNTDMYGLINCDASQQYYNSIINMYASWGVDFIKCDDISVTEFRKWDNPYTADYEIEMIRKAIDNCGRQIVLSLSPGPAPRDKAEHLCKNANMWRLTGDFWDSWYALSQMFDKCVEWTGVGKTGNYPDCDMLPIGRLSKNGTCHGAQNRYSQFTKDEQYTLMSLWGIFKSPLMIGGNMPENDDFTLSLLTNAEYMQMHSTSYGAKEIVRQPNGTIVWCAKGKNCKYFAIFNTADKERKIKFDLTEIVMPNVKYKVYDIWEGQNIGEFKNTITTQVGAHGAKLFKIM
jgi:hypothetical protein